MDFFDSVTEKLSSDREGEYQKYSYMRNDKYVFEFSRQK